MADIRIVKMFGTGNFIIGKTLYAFRDGEAIKTQYEKHVPLLEAEAKRRELLYNKTQAINARAKAE